MNFQHTQNKSRVFLGGVPSNMSSGELLSHLSEYVQVECIEEVGGTSGNTWSSDTIIDKGYCVVRLKNRFEAEHLLTLGKIHLKERRLIILPYLHGKQVHRINAMNNKRRAIIKGVPSDLPENYVVNKLERDYGPITHVFTFDQPYNEKKRKGDRNFLTYSVMFKNKEDSKRAILDQKIVLAPKVECQIERFFPQRKKFKKANNHDHSQPMQRLFFTTDLSRGFGCKGRFKPENFHRKSPFDDGDERFHHDKYKSNSHFKIQAQAADPCFRAGPNIGPREHGLIEMDQRNNLRNHWVKPCSKNYEQSTRKKIHDEASVRFNKHGSPGINFLRHQWN